MTVHNLLELWKLIQVGLLGFETTSVDIWCFKRVRVLLKDKISVRIGGWTPYLTLPTPLPLVKIRPRGVEFQPPT